MGFHILSTSEVVLAWWPVMPPASSNQSTRAAHSTRRVVLHYLTTLANAAAATRGNSLLSQYKLLQVVSEGRHICAGSEQSLT